MTVKIPNDLFDPRLSSRRDDAGTSHAAAESMISTARRHHSLILDVMRRGGLWSAQEIADATSIDYVAVARRMCELRRKGFVHRTDEKHRNRSGRLAYKYICTETKEDINA